MNLSGYDLILVNSSGGKDSQAMLDVVASRARDEGVLERLIVVHCDLGDMEWQGTKEIAQRQAQAYGLRFEVVRNPNWIDLLDRIESRGKWPDSGTRYCTSEFKTGQVKKLCTALVRELQLARPVKILNCLGIRAQESPGRAKRPTFRRLELGWSNGKRHVDEWLPIHDWTTEQVWERIKASGVESHYAYDLGMPRVSCVFCVFASPGALKVAARANPELAQRYAAAEERMGHTFRNKFSIRELVDAALQGDESVEITDWVA